MTSATIYRTLGRIFHDFAVVETGAIAGFGLLLSTPYLTDEERRFVVDRIRPDELAHAQMTASWGQRWGVPASRRPLAFGALVQRDVVAAAQLPHPTRFAFCLATLHWNEANLLQSARHILDVLAAVEPAAESDFEQLLRDEVTHVTWTERVLARLGQNNPTVTRMFDCYHELTNRVYPTIVHRAHAAPLLRVRDALSEEPRPRGLDNAVTQE